MRRLKAEDLEEGMVLAEDIYRDGEILLVKKGAALTDSLLRHISRLGIPMVGIEGEDENPPPALDPEEIEKIKDAIEGELSAKFQRVSKNPLMSQLREVFFKYLLSVEMK